MSSVFKIIEIEGKGNKCIATKDIKKGALILYENPQMPASADAEPMGSPKWGMILFKSFNKMTKDDQNEYLALRNKVSEEIIDQNLATKGLKSNIEKVVRDPKRAEKIFQICCIYISHRMTDGLRIKTSFFKHSCKPNATTVQMPDTPFQIRAIADIKTGQEININCNSIDQFYGFRNKVLRKKILLMYPPFIHCECDLCERETDFDTSEFNPLIREVEDLAESPQTLENCRKKVKCYKEMFELGKTHNVQPYFLYAKILSKAHYTAGLSSAIHQSTDMPREVANLQAAMKKLKIDIFGKNQSWLPQAQNEN